MHVRRVVRTAPVLVAVVQFHADEIELAVVHAALGAHRIGEAPHGQR